MTLLKALPRAAVLGAVMSAAGIFTSAAIAQDAISESHMAAAKNVAEVTKVLEPFDEILPILAEQTRTAFIQAEPTRAEEIIEITQDVALQLAPTRSDLNKLVYQAWATNFTEEELNQLAEFYTTDLGQKLTSSLPAVTQLSVGAAREWQDKLSTDMVTMVQQELQKRNKAE
ncbi:DUF2059 domain-containing protein [Labrenzia sp. DG1229]|uniref:DUF2059 domain-containing protein n=1 Tax=Labrenzia sp. DG1229 TaxID=681847 RepID=UPI0005602D91|nr:DUF2059 domain-containing protein [Labrenzia sp. DG1229]